MFVPQSICACAKRNRVLIKAHHTCKDGKFLCVFCCLCHVALISTLQDESMIRYVSPVNPAVYPHLAVTLLIIGLFFTAWFFVYPITLSLLYSAFLMYTTRVSVRKILPPHPASKIKFPKTTPPPCRFCIVIIAVYLRVFYVLDYILSHEVTSTKFSRYLLKELLISLWSALFMGFGVLFLLLWVGIYV